MRTTLAVRAGVCVRGGQGRKFVCDPLCTVLMYSGYLDYAYGKKKFPYLVIKNMKIDYKKCHTNRMYAFYTKEYNSECRNLNTLRISVN